MNKQEETYVSICVSNPQKYEQDQIKSVSNSKKLNKITKKQQSNKILDIHPISNQYLHFSIRQLIYNISDC